MLHRMGLMSLVVALCASVSLADGFIIVHHWPPHPPHPPHPVPRPRPIRSVHQWAPLTIRNHQVEVAIKGGVAVTEIDQTFHNPNNARLEGTYIFPIPKGAEIDRFEMDINGKLVEAELLEAKKARQIYEDIVRSMKDPALMEYADQRAFKVRIFPIEPNSDKRIRIKYTQLLESDSGLTSYIYPLNTEKFSAEPIKTVSVKVELETDRPIKSIYSPSHEVEINRKGKKKVVVGFETSNARPDTDFQLIYSEAPKEGGDIGVGVRTYRDDESGYFMLLASPGDDLDEAKIVKKDVVFVVDTSGSMAGEKLKQAKKALTFCIDNLNKGDRFEIVRFSTEAEALFGKLVDADDDHREKASAFVDGFKPTGGTAIEEALLKAIAPGLEDGRKGRPYVVVFLTDGRPTIGTTNEDEIVKALDKKVSEATIRVFNFGIGTDINTHLLDRIAERTRAVSQYVLPEEDIEVKVSNFFSKITYPVLSELELKFTNVRVTERYPKHLPDLFKGQQLVVFGKYDGHGDSAITLSGTVNGKQVEHVFEASFAKKDRGEDYIPRLWAVRRVGYLLDQIRLHGEETELREEVTRLARQYGIVTPYTSYLIIEDEGRRNTPVASRTFTRRIAADPAAGSDDFAEPSAPAPVREADRLALRERAEEFHRAKSGESAVADAESSRELKYAQSLPGAANAGGRGGGGFGPADKPLVVDATPDVNGRLGGDLDGADGDASGGVSGLKQDAAVVVERKFVRGRTFYFNGRYWVDAEVPRHADAERVEIELGSDAYFELLRRSDEVTAWCSVGDAVQLYHEGKVYVIE